MRKGNVSVETKHTTCQTWNWNPLIVFLGGFFLECWFGVLYRIGLSILLEICSNNLHLFICKSPSFLELQNQSNLSPNSSFQARHIIASLWPQWVLYLCLLGTHSHRYLARTVITIVWKRNVEKKAGKRLMLFS